MLYSEKLKEILSKTGIDVSTLPDSLYSTILQAISTGGSGGSSASVENNVLILSSGSVENNSLSL